jgi:large subunit ribosomal protein L10
MGEPRADKVAVVAEVKEKLEAADGVLLTEYRGLNVPAMAALRANLTPAGGEYKIYKNTLVKLAANELGMELDDLLTGPTALAFVGEKADGSKGDPAAVAKALRDYSKTNDALIIKGGVLDGKALSSDEIKALADLPSREVLFAEFAGAMEHMLGDFAGLLDNKLREFVGCMEALVEKGGPGGAGNPDASAPAEAVAETSADEAPASDDAPADSGEAAASDSGEAAASDSASEEE